MVRIFSFCLYGNNPKYCIGLFKNIEYIASAFPDFETWVAVGSDVPDLYKKRLKSFSRVRVFQYDLCDGRLMTNRFFFIDDPDVECMIVRDTDSRITARDEWCIRHFLNNQKGRIFTIRDHPYHKREIMGGQWGLWKIPSFTLQDAYAKFKMTCNNLAAYDSDQEFLKLFVYEPYKSDLIVYSSAITYSGETIEPILLEHTSQYDFCGNVVDFDADGKEVFMFDTDSSINNV